MQPCGLPGARNKSAAEGARHPTHRPRLLTGGRLAGHYRAHQRVLQARPETSLVRRLITHHFVPCACHAELDGVFNNVLAEGGTKALSKASHATAPFVRAVAGMVDRCTRS